MGLCPPHCSVRVGTGSCGMGTKERPDTSTDGSRREVRARRRHRRLQAGKRKPQTCVPLEPAHGPETMDHRRASHHESYGLSVHASTRGRGSTGLCHRGTARGSGAPRRTRSAHPGASRPRRQPRIFALGQWLLGHGHARQCRHRLDRGVGRARPGHHQHGLDYP
jgi:hypothetical protein